MDDRNTPATRGDIQDLRTEVDGLRTKVDGLQTKVDGVSMELNEKIEILRGEVNHNYHDLVERIDDGQTKLLNAFYGFIQSIRERFKAEDDMESGLKKRLTLVEERLTDLERKVSFPNYPSQ